MVGIWNFIRSKMMHFPRVTDSITRQIKIANAIILKLVVHVFETNSHTHMLPPFQTVVMHDVITILMF